MGYVVSGQTCHFPDEHGALWSFSLVLRGLSISPTYSSSHIAHFTEYTTPCFSSACNLSLGATKACLMVYPGWECWATLCFLYMLCSLCHTIDIWKYYMPSHGCCTAIQIFALHTAVIFLGTFLLSFFKGPIWVPTSFKASLVLFNFHLLPLLICDVGLNMMKEGADHTYLACELQGGGSPTGSSGPCG